MILTFIPKRRKNFNKQISKLQQEIDLFLSKIDAVFLHYCIMKFSLFHAWCFTCISGSVLASENELSSEDIQRRYF